MKGQLGASSVLALGLALGGSPARAAHLYAATNNAIQVYDVAANGSLQLRQTFPSGVPAAMAITPGGRFLYVADGGGSAYTGPWISEYAVQSDGTIRPWAAPTKVCEIEGTHDLAVHPTTGDYLYTVATTGCAYRTDDADGHLDFSSQYGVGTDGYRIVAHPGGAFLLALASKRGSVVSIRTNPDGTVAGTAGRFGVPDGMFGFTAALTADSRFVYTAAVPDEPAPASGVLVVLALRPDGSMIRVNSMNVPITRWDYQRLLAVRGSLLAASAGGPTSHLDIYAVGYNGSMRLASSAPIEVYAMAAGKGDWASNLWVATDDGIVTYRVNVDGTLVRVSKAFVNGVSDMVYGVK